MKPKNLRPSRILIYCCAPLVLLGLLLMILQFNHGLGPGANGYQYLESCWLFLLSILVLLTIYDLLSQRSAVQIKMTRSLPHTVPVSQWVEVEIKLSHGFLKQRVIEFIDGAPQNCLVDCLPARLRLVPGKVTRLVYKIKATERGDNQFVAAQVRLSSVLGLWQFVYTLGDDEMIKVYPNFARIGHFNLLSMSSHVPQLGIRKKPRRGEGLEFHQLREYRQGDNPKQIDWKATSKKQKLISREYQEERDQQLIFMLDGGRGMRTLDSGVSHFDHALDAMLLLSYIALRQGDGIGLYWFSHGASRWVPPKKGIATINGLLNSVYDLQPSLDSTDYSKVCEDFLQYRPRRSLVILLTNTRNEDFEDLRLGISQLQKRHLVLVANMKEQVLLDQLSKPVESMDHALSYAATAEYLSRRKQINNTLQNSNIYSIDETPSGFAAKIVNQYLDIKKAGIL